MNVFVIMPFDQAFDSVYRDLIKIPLEGEGFNVARADDPGDDRIIHENIYDEIVQNLWDADYVIADLTNSNPNVYYELGIAHTLNKRTVRIAQDTNSIPFNIQAQMVIQYSPDEDESTQLSAKILKILRLAKNDNYIFSNIVDDFVTRKSRKIITVPAARS